MLVAKNLLSSSTHIYSYSRKKIVTLFLACSLLQVQPALLCSSPVSMPFYTVSDWVCCENKWRRGSLLKKGMCQVNTIWLLPRAYSTNTSLVWCYEIFIILLYLQLRWEQTSDQLFKCWKCHFLFQSMTDKLWLFRPGWLAGILWNTNKWNKPITSKKNNWQYFLPVINVKLSGKN